MGELFITTDAHYSSLSDPAMYRRHLLLALHGQEADNENPEKDRR